MINFIQAAVYCRLHYVRGRLFRREMEAHVDTFVGKKLELRVVVLLGVCQDLHVTGGEVGCKSLDDLRWSLVPFAAHRFHVVVHLLTKHLAKRL